MKKHILSVLSALLLFCAYTGNAQNSSDKEPYSVNKFANAKITDARVETTGGNITVTGDNATEPRVEMFVTPNNSRRSILSKEEIKQKLEADYDITISVSGNRLTAIAHRKKNNDRDWDQTVNVSFKLFVPKNISTDLLTSGGNITLSGINGTQDFRTSGGNLHLQDLTGKLTGKTSGGNIVVKNVKDNMDLSTSGGNIDASDCSGTIGLRTSGGNLDLSDLKGEIRAATSGGNVHGDHISGDLATQTSGGSIRLKEMSGSVDASTSGGNIDLSVTELSKKITLSNSSGDITLRLPKNKGMDLRMDASRISTESLTNFKGTQDRERIDGSLNGGGIPVRVNAGSGTIHLSFQ